MEQIKLLWKLNPKKKNSPVDGEGKEAKTQSDKNRGKTIANEPA